MRSRKILSYAIVPAALFGLVLMPSTSRATISFTTSPVHTTTNLGDFDQVDANTVLAKDLNNNQIPPDQPVLRIETYDSKGGTDVAIEIQSPGGGGQAFLQAVSAPIGYVDLTPVNPPFQGFSVLEFNPFVAQGEPDGSLYLIATDQFGNTFTSATFTFDDSGENRIAAEAADGQVIVRLEAFVEPPSADVLKQFRVDAVFAPPPPPPPPPPPEAPEPSTIAMGLSGIAMLGVAALRRHRRRPDVPA